MQESTSLEEVKKELKTDISSLAARMDGLQLQLETKASLCGIFTQPPESLDTSSGTPRPFRDNLFIALIQTTENEKRIKQVRK